MMGRILMIWASIALLGLRGAAFAEEPGVKCDWDLIFDYSEIPPNPGAGAERSVTRFECRQDGVYSLTQSVFAVAGELLKESSSVGTLSGAVWTNLQRHLCKADLASLPQQTFDLPGGSGEEDGWGGRIQFRAGGKTIAVRFNSRGGWPVDKEPQQQAQRLMDFISAMNGLILPQIHRSSQPPAGGDGKPAPQL